MSEEWSPIPDYCEPLVGWRFWRIDEQTRLLKNFSWWFNVLWQPYQAIEAAHELHCADAYYCDLLAPAGGTNEPRCPGSPCLGRGSVGCGIYAYKNEQTARTVDQEYLQRWCSRSFPWVVGEVYLWGRIIEHQQGYRAQFAYPKRLVAYGCSRPKLTISALAARYGIPGTEEPSWKSENPLDGSLLNPWRSQSLCAYPTQSPSVSRANQLQLQMYRQYLTASPSPSAYPPLFDSKGLHRYWFDQDDDKDKGAK